MTHSERFRTSRNDRIREATHPYAPPERGLFYPFRKFRIAIEAEGERF